MGSFEISKPRGMCIAASADMVGPGSVVKSAGPKGSQHMPGDVPPTTPTPMIKPFKQKVLLVKNKPEVTAKDGNGGKVEKTSKISRNKGKAPSAKTGKLVAGGPGSGRHKQMVKMVEDKGFTQINRQTWHNGKKDYMHINSSGKGWQHINEKGGLVSRGKSVDSLRTHLESVPKVNRSIVGN